MRRKCRDFLENLRRFAARNECRAGPKVSKVGEHSRCLLLLSTSPTTPCPTLCCFQQAVVVMSSNHKDNFEIDVTTK